MAFPTRRAAFPSTTPLNAATGDTVTTAIPYPGASLAGDLVTVTFHGLHALNIADDFAPPYTLSTGRTQVVPLAGSGAAWTLAGWFDWWRTDTLVNRSATWYRTRGAETNVQVTTGRGWNHIGSGIGSGRQDALITTLAFADVPDATIHNFDISVAAALIDPHAPGPEDLLVGICHGGRTYSNVSGWNGATAFANNVAGTIATTILSRPWTGGDLPSGSIPLGSSPGMVSSFYLSGAPVIVPSSWVRTGSAILGNATRVGWS